MKTRKLISVILLLVLCIQLLPLKQTIAWLLGNQVTEELVHTGGKSDTGNPDGGNPGNELGKHFLLVYSPALEHGLILSSSSRSLSGHAVQLPRRHADDIPTPPPNCQVIALLKRPPAGPFPPGNSVTMPAAYPWQVGPYYDL